MSSFSTRTRDELKTPTVQVAWRSWPLVEGRPWSWLVVLIFPAVSYLVEWIVESRPAGVVVACLLAVSLWRFLLPVAYELSTRGVHQTALRWRRVIPWSAIASYQVRQRGIFLFPTLGAVPFDALHGLYLPWGDHRDEVVEVVARYLGHPPNETEPETEPETEQEGTSE